MDPKHLVYLSVVLEKGSLTEAARHLAVTQPTLTRIMATLEMQAGDELFSRSRYGVKATPVGEALAREGRAIQRNVELAEQTAARFRYGFSQEVRIGVGPMLAATVIPPILQRISQQAWNSCLTLSVNRPMTLIDKLIDGEIDLQISPAAELRTIAGCQRTVLCDDQIGIFCSRNHPLASKQDLTLDDFKGVPWISMGHASPFEHQVMEMLKGQGLSNVHLHMMFQNDGHMLLSVLQQGTHLAVLPITPIRCSRYRDELVELKLNTGLVQQRNLYLWARDEFKDHPVTTMLLDSFRAVVAQYS